MSLTRRLRRGPNKSNHRIDDRGNSLAKCSVSVNLTENVDLVTSLLGKSEDILVRHFQLTVSGQPDRRAVVYYLKGFVTDTTIEAVLRSMEDAVFASPQDLRARLHQRLHLKQVKDDTNLRTAVNEVLNGAMLFLIEGLNYAIVGYGQSIDLRSIAEPPSHTVVRGSREGFVESVDTNLFLLRRRIHDTELRFEEQVVGQVTNTRVMLGYIEGIAAPEIIAELRERLTSIDVDALSTSGELEQYIEDNPYTIFPTIGNTERPDDASLRLLRGQVMLLVDGDPMTLFVPHRFIEAFHDLEDYSSRPYYTSLIRLLRFIAFAVSVLAPSVFVMASNFDKEIIPSELISNIAQAEEHIPFPVPMEVLVMVVMFELVREAGIRMPRPIGQAVSIVGALILGQVSVQAGIVGAPTIIAVATASIATFLITPIADVATILRLAFLIPTTVFGTFGLFTMFLIVLTHVVSATSITVPYMAPFAPIDFHDWKDTFVRLPIGFYRDRMRSIPNLKLRRIRTVPTDRRGVR